jgi:deoxyribonuclease-4
LRAGTIEPDQLVAVCAAANAPVILETDPATQADDIAWLRAQLS